jgi:membrane associated rhomboid family serine protease
VQTAASDLLTRIVVAVTAACWVFTQFAVDTNTFIIGGGFIPARFGGDIELPWMLPAFLTPLSSSLLHAGAMHLAFNMITFYYCGRQVEMTLGAKSLAVLYLVGAYGAAFAHYLNDPVSMVPMVGASGAISAVIGTYAMLFSQSETKAIGPIPAFWVRALWLAAAWIGVQWLIGFAGKGSGFAIATDAHIGGFLVGVLLARPLVKWRFR